MKMKGDLSDPEIKELVQVMAVAAARIENHLFGLADSKRTITAGGQTATDIVLNLIREERERQDEKWGNQVHDPIEWSMILAEEVGEWAGEVLAKSEDSGDGAWDVLHVFWSAGEEGARVWLETHEWPVRQQRVFDTEKDSE